MPAAPRWNKKAKKIVRSLIGKPDNAIDEESPHDKKIKNWLIFEEGQWTR